MNKEKIIKEFEHRLNEAKGDYLDFADITVDLGEEILALLKEQEGTINELQNAYGYLQKQFFEAQDKLLKEQEAKPVIADKRNIIWDDSYDEATYFEDTFYCCPSCNRILSRTHMKKSIHFCEECGQKVKWE